MELYPELLPVLEVVLPVEVRGVGLFEVTEVIRPRITASMEAGKGRPPIGLLFELFDEGFEGFKGLFEGFEGLFELLSEAADLGDL